LESSIFTLDYDWLSVCIIAITTAASHSFDAGLAAGSYAIGFGAVAIACLDLSKRRPMSG
jgi:hypothetical protein